MSKYAELVDVKGDGRVVIYKRDDLKNPKWQIRITKASRTKESSKKVGAYPFE